jgi:hypothetical protein
MKERRAVVYTSGTAAFSSYYCIRKISACNLKHFWCILFKVNQQKRASMIIQKECRLHQVGRSLRLTIPVEIVRAFRLSAHDSVLLASDEHGATLKFYRMIKTPATVKEEQLEAVG